EYPELGTRAGALNTPPPVVFKSRRIPSCGLLTVTVASGTTAPVESVTVPLMPPTPAAAWPNPLRDTAEQINTANMICCIVLPTVTHNSTGRCRYNCAVVSH